MIKSFFLKTGLFITSLLRSKIVWQSVLVGLLCGVVVVAFRVCIESLFSFIIEFSAKKQYIYFLPLVALLGGLVSGILVFKLAPETKGSGIPFVKMCLQRSGKTVRIRTIFVKFIAGVSAIGTGMSLGREGPSVQLGAGVGSFVGNLFKLKNSNKDTLIASGAGAAIAATFNAPIAGTIFVLEELLNRFSSSILFPCLVATVTASSVSRYLLGNKTIFACEFVPAVFNSESIIIYILLAIVSGILGVLFSKTIFFFDNLYEKLNKIPNYIKPAIASLIIGIVGIYLPQVLSGGNTVVEVLLNNGFPIVLVLIIFLVKFIMTPLCFGSGAPGGIFLPMLMLGAFLGYVVGYIALKFGFDINPSTMAFIGMAAFLSAVARTPITATVMVFEMTGGYESILPIMLVSALSDMTAEKLGQKPIYSKLLLESYRKCSNNPQLSSKLVENYMTKYVKSFAINDDINAILKIMNVEKHNAYPVVDEKQRLQGIITKADIEDVLTDNNNSIIPVGRIMNTNPTQVYKYDNLYTCYYRLHNNNTEWAIVINQKNNVEGIITRADILREI